MKIVITADLHYDIARSRSGAAELAKRICEGGGDALVLVGDSAGARLEPLRECLELFRAFGGRKFFVPGNHCLWCREGENSIDRYERIVPEAASQCGFDMLDHQPAIMGADTSGMGVPPMSLTGVPPVGEEDKIKGNKSTTGGTPVELTGKMPVPRTIGLVGSIGWYDYSLRDHSLEIPDAFYRAKVAPGAANYLSEHRHLVEAHREQLTERHLDMGARWMDGVHVRLGMSDEEFVARLAKRLAEQLNELSPKVERIVAFLHHLPFRQLIPQDRPDRFAFAAAYMGSSQLGQVLLACPKVTHVYCGHSHWPADETVGHIRVVNIGSTYVEKKLSVLEI